MEQFKTLVIRNRATTLQLPQPVYATLGSFDGIHIGHQALCRRVLQRRAEGAAGPAGQGSTAVITFYPHPSNVVQGASTAPALVNLRQKTEILSGLGIDVLYLMHFTAALSTTGAASFLDHHVVARLNVSHLVVGPDAHVGHRREGTPEFIRQHLSRAGRSAEIMDFVSIQGGRVSSGRVRQAVQAADFSLVQSLLGRSYALEGRVEHGDGRGRTIGVPTANLAVPGVLLPPYGVYAARVRFNDAWYSAAVNIGNRPTFSGSAPRVEAHLLDYQGGEIYGVRMEISLVSKIRDEQKFSSAQALQSQIKADIEAVRSALSALGSADVGVGRS